MQIYAGWTALNTSTGNQTLTATGMTDTVKLAFHRCASNTTGFSLVATHRASLGVTDGTTQRSIALISENGTPAATTDAGGRYDTATCILNTVAVGTALDSEASHVSFGAGTHTVNIDNAPATALIDQHIFFGGADTEVAIVDYTGSGTNNTTVAVSGLSFAPNLAIVFGRGSAAFAADTAFAGRSFIQGYAVKTPSGAIEQFCYGDAQANNTTNCRSVFRSNRCAARVTAGADQGALEVTAWNSDGADITSRDLPAGDAVSVVIAFLRAPNALRAVSAVYNTDTDGDIAVTGIGFQPKAYLCLASNLAALDTSATDTTTSKWSHGIRDQGGNELVIGGATEDGAATANTRSYFAFEGAFAHIVADDGGEVWEAGHVSFDADGFTFNVNSQTGATDTASGFLVIGPDLVINETVQISDAQTLVQTSFAVSEDVQVSDAQVFASSAILAAETVEVSDAQVFASSMAVAETVEISDDQVLLISAFQANETVEISDAQVFLSSAILAEETVTIADDVVLVEEGSNDLVAVIDETVEISDAQVLAVQNLMQVDETVTISDGQVLIHSAFQANEDVEILEGVVFAGTGVLATVNEDVQVSDAVVAFLGQVLQADETVTIADDVTFGAGLVPIRVGPARNNTLQGGAEMGTTSQGGAVKGGTES